MESALAAHEAWARTDWYHRVAVFVKAATLLAGPRRTRNTAAVMLNHSKNPYEAEIDLAELVDFWNFNAHFTRQVYEMPAEPVPGGDQPVRLAAARGVRPRHPAVQLLLDRREPADRSRDGRQRRRSGSRPAR